MQQQISIQDLLSGKMFPEPSAVTKEKTSVPSSKRSATRRAAEFLYLNLRGGGWSHAGTVVAEGFSLAWRLYDAQFWGVPQRRKRIYLIADFGSERAGEILFESEGMRWNSKTGRTAWENASRYVEGCAGRGVPWLFGFFNNDERDMKEDGIVYAECERKDMNDESVLL